MSKYVGITTLKVGGVEVAGRIFDVHIGDAVSPSKRPIGIGKKKSAAKGETVDASFTLEAVGFFRTEDWKPALDFFFNEPPTRRERLANEIRAAEVDLFAAVMRYWVYLL